jgi:hypothetical protein
MSIQSEIKINQFQLALLLDESDKDFFKCSIAHNVYCLNCRDVAKNGIDITELYLTEFNDNRVHGRCKICNCEVRRLFEFGEEDKFNNKAKKLRKSIQAS